MNEAKPMSFKRIQIGKILLENNLITKEQLDKAIVQQSVTNQKLGKVLIDLGFIKEEQLLQLISKQLDYPFIDLKNFKPNNELVQVLPEAVARRIQCIVLDKTDNGYLVGMVDPQDILAFDELEDILKKPIKIAIVRESDLIKMHDLFYRHAEQILSLAEELSTEMGKSDYDLAQLSMGLSLTDAPVAKLLQTIFEDAVQVNASDVHIEPDEKVLRIRQRIDGILQENILKETNVADALSLRLKLMAGLNIAEKRLPQDGRFSIKVRDKTFDIRLSTMPGQFGESVVIRLLNQAGGALTLSQVGMPKALLADIRKIMSMPHGLLLITGPTGSGKSTSLYAMLNELNTTDVKIITVEDPVEYRLPRVTQVQVQPKISLDFARVLRAALRQDPDIIMIGELRDHETAEIAIRAAMTGHFVFATLHTNDAVSSAERLLDMGIQGYLLASVLRGVLAQRLVRKICQNCFDDYTPTPQEEIWLTGQKFEDNNVKFKYGVGCHYCNNTGFKGQIGIFELLIMNKELIKALHISDTQAFYNIAYSDKNFQTLAQSGLQLAIQGITTIGEVMRITVQVA